MGQEAGVVSKRDKPAQPPFFVMQLKTDLMGLWCCPANFRHGLQRSPKGRSPFVGGIAHKDEQILSISPFGWGTEPIPAGH